MDRLRDSYVTPHHHDGIGMRGAAVRHHHSGIEMHGTAFDLL
jgi:hypothetical protein